MKQVTDIKKQFDFEESQRFTNWLAWTVMAGTLALMLTILIYQLVTGNKVGNKPAPNGVLIGLILIYYVPAILLLIYARLTVRINKDAVYYGWNIPTKDLNKINWTDVQSCEIITYKFVGYGYRLTKKYGIVYNAKGNKGLLITKKSGEKVLLGSLKTEQMGASLAKLGVSYKYNNS